MQIVVILAFVGILSMNLAFSHILWRNPVSHAILKDAMKLSAFTTMLWTITAFIVLPILSALTTNPLQLFRVYYRMGQQAILKVGSSN